MKMLVAGEWVDGVRQLEVNSPYSGELIDVVPEADLQDVERALAAAVHGGQAIGALPAFERAAILERAAGLIDEDVATLAQTITAEQGKPAAEARLEASRIAAVLTLCAEEARRIYGEVLPMDAAPIGVGRLGYTRPEPTGPVVAITPFNYPAILVIHKIGPALAAGNAVILKPASTTPLTALFLAERLQEAGLPPLALQCLTGPGTTVGQALCSDHRVRKISFTGSLLVGEAIARAAGAKRLTCELGSNAAAVILHDADVNRAADAIAFSGYTNSGQNCVSSQRVIVRREIREDFVERLTERLDGFVAGDPAHPSTTLGPVINQREAERIVSWIRSAEDDGATVLRGGDSDGALVAPGLVVDPTEDAHIWRDELFGPAVSVRSVASDEEALRLANDTRYGLAANVMTRDIDRALTFAHGLRAGMVNVNPPQGSTWRADFMPWGGFGASGFGKEGVKYAVREMTEDKLVVIHTQAS